MSEHDSTIEERAARGELFSCRHCGTVEPYTPAAGIFLLLWWLASEAFEAQLRACQGEQRALIAELEQALEGDVYDAR